MNSRRTPSPALHRGYAYGLLGVLVFALTLPMTRLATGTAAAPQLDGIYIAGGRAVVAAMLSALFLLAVRAPWPARAQWPTLAWVALGVVFGFPFCTSIARRLV
jgi:drug/metabolite transporter (DMT)-like permease